MLRAHRNPNDLYFLKANPRKTRPFPKGSFGFQVFSRTNVKWENFDFMVQNGWLGQFSRFKVVFFFPEMFWYRNVSVFLKGRVGFQVYLGGGFKYFLCSSLPRKMIQFDENIFQMGWFNHVPGTWYQFLVSIQCRRSNISIEPLGQRRPVPPGGSLASFPTPWQVAMSKWQIQKKLVV